MAFTMLTTDVARVDNDGRFPVLTGVQSVLDLIDDAWTVADVSRLVIMKKDVSEDFFNLRTGVAAGMLRRFVDYGFRVAIVGDFSCANKSLRDFIRESNEGRIIHFAADIDAAVNRLRG